MPDVFDFDPPKYEFKKMGWWETGCFRIDGEWAWYERSMTYPTWHRVEHAAIDRIDGDPTNNNLSNLRAVRMPPTEGGDA